MDITGRLCCICLLSLNNFFFLSKYTLITWLSLPTSGMTTEQRPKRPIERTCEERETLQALELVKAAYLNVSFMKVQLASICRVQADLFDSHSGHKAREHASECSTLQTIAQSFLTLLFSAHANHLPSIVIQFVISLFCYNVIRDRHCLN